MWHLLAMSIIIYFLFSAFLFFAGCFILFTEAKKSNSNYYLGSAILIKSIIQISFILAMVFKQEPFLKPMLKAVTPLYFMMPALIFFYFRNTLSNTKPPMRNNLIHFIPFLIVSAMGVFDLFGYSKFIAFNQTNMSFNEFFILQTISSKYLAALQPTIIMGYLIYIYVKFLRQYTFLKLKSLQSNTQLLIAFWFVLFGTQIAKIGKLIYGEFILNSVGDVLFYMINLFVIFQLYKLFLTLYLMGNSLLAFRNYGKNEREN